MRQLVLLVTLAAATVAIASGCTPSIEDAAGLLRNHVRSNELPLTRTCQLVEVTEADQLPPDAHVLAAQLGYRVEDSVRDLVDAFADPAGYADDSASCAAAALGAQLSACDATTVVAAWRAGTSSPELAPCIAALDALEAGLEACVREQAWTPAVELYATLRAGGASLRAVVERPAELARVLDLSGPLLTAMIYFANGLDTLAQRVTSQLGPASGVASLVVEEIVAGFVATAAEQILRELERHQMAEPVAIARASCAVYRGRESYPRPTVELLRRLILRVAPESERRFAAAALCADKKADLGDLCEDIAEATGATEALEREHRVTQALDAKSAAALDSDWQRAQSLAGLEDELVASVDGPSWWDELWGDGAPPAWELATPQPDPLRGRLRELESARPAQDDTTAALAAPTAVRPPSRGWALRQSADGCRAECDLETLRERAGALVFLYPRVADETGLDPFGASLVGTRLDALAQSLQSGQAEILATQLRMEETLAAQSAWLGSLERRLAGRLDNLEAGMLSLAGCRDAILATRERRLAVARELFDVPADWSCPSDTSAPVRVFGPKPGVTHAVRVRSSILCTSEPFAVELAVEGLTACRAPVPTPEVVDDIARVVAALERHGRGGAALESMVFVGHTDETPIQGQCSVSVPWSSSTVKVVDNPTLAALRGRVFAEEMRKRLPSAAVPVRSELLSRIDSAGDVSSALQECSGAEDPAACRAQLRRVTVQIESPALDYDLSCLK